MHAVLAAISRHPLPALDLRDRGVFARNLAFVHAMIVASEPLLEGVLKRKMPAALRAFYRTHLKDERGHAQWLAADLRALKHAPELNWRAAQLAGTQYYLARHAPPEVLLGYMAALECRPMPLSVVDSLERAHGSRAVRTLRYHAEHDIAHGAEVLAMIDASEHGDAILHNAELTASMLAWALADEPSRRAA